MPRSDKDMLIQSMLSDNRSLAAKLDIADRALAAAEARADAAERALRERDEALQRETPWPVADVLTRLADAAEHLLTVHDCDNHGWEGVVYARDEARQIVRKLAALASPPVAHTEQSAVVAALKQIREMSPGQAHDQAPAMARAALARTEG